MIRISKYCRLKNQIFLNNGEILFTGENDMKYAEFLTATYRHLAIQYPKFFKMDELSKTGFLAAEVLLSASDSNKVQYNELMPVFMLCSSSSLETDENFELTTGENYFPSPSVFVYTLPNIVLGEIAIRHKLYGENTCFICENLFDEIVFDYICQSINDAQASEAMVLYIDQYNGTGEMLALLLSSHSENGNEKMVFTTSLVNDLLNN